MPVTAAGARLIAEQHALAAQRTVTRLECELDDARQARDQAIRHLAATGMSERDIAALIGLGKSRIGNVKRPAGGRTA
jgi:ribosomal protein S11